MTSTYIHTKHKPGIAKRILRFLGILYFVGLLAALVYLWLFTQDRFISTAEFQVSKQDLSGGASVMPQLALPGIADSGSVDSQIAIGYINSSDLLLQLEKDFDLIKHYSSPTKDIVFRMDPHTSVEKRLEYYQKRITCHFDAETGMTVITVDTFSPELSKKIASYLLKHAEDFVNVINQNIADTQMRFIRGEIERSAKRVEELNAELVTLQNAHNLIEPSETISANLKTVQEMRMTRLKAEADLSSILRDSPNSPRIETLRSRLSALDELIATESAKLSGPEQNRLNQLLVQFSQLKLRLDFAIRLRESAESLLEKNRIEATAKSRFFTIIQSPFLPEEVGWPRRPYATCTLIVLGLLLFLILQAISRSIFDRV